LFDKAGGLTLACMSASAETKQAALRQLISESAPLVIAFSGGVDSAFLLAVAVATVGERCLGAIADSPSLPRQALSDAVTLAAQIGVRLEVIRTDEMQDRNYTANPVNRCYFCKAELFTKLDRLARERGFRAIAYGENADDAHQVRPGRQAASEFQILSPLKEVGLTKAEIRLLSRAMSLPTADLPAQPCLSSRIPHGTPVTPEALATIERAEAAVRALGFRVFRVRHQVEPERVSARVEISPNEMPRLEHVAQQLRAVLLGVGYDSVSIDSRGYRSPVA
jgi:uncharacterized protein